LGIVAGRSEKGVNQKAERNKNKKGQTLKVLVSRRSPLGLPIGGTAV